jgi:hypothetical protein
MQQYPVEQAVRLLITCTVPLFLIALIKKKLEIIIYEPLSVFFSILYCGYEYLNVIPHCQMCALDEHMYFEVVYW